MVSYRVRVLEFQWHTPTKNSQSTPQDIGTSDVSLVLSHLSKSSCSFGNYNNYGFWTVYFWKMYTLLLEWNQKLISVISVCMSVVGMADEAFVYASPVRLVRLVVVIITLQTRGRLLICHFRLM